jgi:hypothetical protein
MEGSFVAKPSPGWYAKVDQETGEVESEKFREADTNTKEFWNGILKNDKFKKFICQRYSISYGSILSEESEIETA